MPKPSYIQNTNYFGLSVDKDVAEQIKDQNISEYLRFEEMGNQVVIQAKLPEVGMSNGEVYDIRYNMNLIAKGMANYILDENGNIDINKASELSNFITDFYSEATSSPFVKFNKEKATEELINKLGIPDEKRENFKKFIKANGVPANNGDSLLMSSTTGPFGMMASELIGTILQYQKYLNDPKHPEAAEFLRKHKTQYENTLLTYKEMANMDPEKETRILYPMDCFAFSTQMQAFCDQNNEFLKSVKMKTIDGKKNQILFNMKENGQDEANGMIVPFKEHYFFSLPVKVNGKNYTLSLENTAPESGKMFHCPAVGRTGVGLFGNKEHIVQYHTEKNKARKIKNLNTFKKIKSYVAKAPFPTVEMPKMDYNLYTQNRCGANFMNDPDKMVENLSNVLSAYTLENVKVPFNEKRIKANGDYIRDLYALDELKRRPEYLQQITQNPDNCIKAGHMLRNEIYGIPENNRDSYISDMKKLLENMMDPEGRSKKYNKLYEAVKNAAELNLESMTPTEQSNAIRLANIEIYDSARIYTDGKESTRIHKDGQARFENSLDALAVVAKYNKGFKVQTNKILKKINDVRVGKNKTSGKGYIDPETFVETHGAKNAKKKNDSRIAENNRKAKKTDAKQINAK